MIMNSCLYYLPLFVLTLVCMWYAMFNRGASKQYFLGMVLRCRWMSACDLRMQYGIVEFRRLLAWNHAFIRVQNWMALMACSVWH